MKHMRLLALPLAMSLGLLLAACDNNAPPPPPPADTPAAQAPAAAVDAEKAAAEHASDKQTAVPGDQQPAALPTDEPGSTALLPGLHPPASQHSHTTAQGGASLSPNARRVLRLLKTDLEDLLTRLNSDARVKP